MLFCCSDSNGPEMGDAEGGAASKGQKKGRLSVERIYQKKSQLEHILLRPDTYIGSVQVKPKNCALTQIIILSLMLNFNVYRTMCSDPNVFDFDSR